MIDRTRCVVASLALLFLAAGCGSPARQLTGPAPSGAAVNGSTGANPDGTTLKASTPVNLSPAHGATLETRTPSLEIQNAVGDYVSASFTYLFELYEVNTLTATFRVPQGSGDRTVLNITEPLKEDTVYRWRARAEYEGGIGAFSRTTDFRTPAPPPPPPPPPPSGGGGGGGGPYGPPRTIDIREAFDIIVRYHNDSGANLGAGSTRDSRVAFFFSAVALVHYGHARWNPRGGDRLWCVKDAGAGRPPSDDVIVRCDTRDAWDLIGGAGANGYTFHIDYIGRLPSEQNVYPPPLSSLPR